MLKKLEVNIPFVDALAQMPNTVKFMKEIMSNKKKLEAYVTVDLFESCNTVIQRKLLEKHKDPSSFIIPCIIGEHIFSKELCDLGENINLMPFSMAKNLNLGEITLINLSLPMVDKLMTFSKGIIEDVLVKVNKFISPVDFMVLDMEEDEKMPPIIGRPFLATSSVTPRILVRPDWRIRIGFRDARPNTGTLYLNFFFLKAKLVPVGMAHIL